MWHFVGASAMLLASSAGAAFNPQASTFSIMAIPDPQYYSETAALATQYYNSQMNWIVASQTTKNVAFVVGLGDNIEDGDPYYPDGTYTGYVSRSNSNIFPNLEWQRSQAAWNILSSANVPYYAVIGNHDYLHNDQKSYPSYWTQYLEINPG